MFDVDLGELPAIMEDDLMNLIKARDPFVVGERGR